MHQIWQSPLLAFLSKKVTPLSWHALLQTMPLNQLYGGQFSDTIMSYMLMAPTLSIQTAVFGQVHWISSTLIIVMQGNTSVKHLIRSNTRNELLTYLLKVQNYRDCFFVPIFVFLYQHHIIYFSSTIFSHFGLFSERLTNSCCLFFCRDQTRQPALAFQRWLTGRCFLIFVRVKFMAPRGCLAHKLFWINVVCCLGSGEIQIEI